MEAKEVLQELEKKIQQFLKTIKSNKELFQANPTLLGKVKKQLKKVQAIKALVEKALINLNLYESVAKRIHDIVFLGNEDAPALVKLFNEYNHNVVVFELIGETYTKFYGRNLNEVIDEYINKQPNDFQLKIDLNRAISAEVISYDRLADQIFEAIDGCGTDEEAVYSALATLKGDKTKLEKLKVVYKERHGADLEKAILEDFDDNYEEEIQRVKELLKPKDANAPLDYPKLAKQIFKAIDGGGTDEETVYRVLGQLKKNLNHIEQLKMVYKTTYGNDLIEDLDSDMDGDEFKLVQELLGIRETAELVDVDSLSDNAQLREQKAQAIIKKLYTEYDIDINSQELEDMIRGTFCLPDDKEEAYNAVYWDLQELAELEKSADYFAPLLGKNRTDSPLANTDQEVDTIGKLNFLAMFRTTSWEVDGNIGGIHNWWDDTIGVEMNFRNNPETLDHEFTHALFGQFVGDFVDAVDFWTSKNSFDANEEEKPVNPSYSTRADVLSAEEDLCDCVAMYFRDNANLQEYTQRYAFVKQLLQEMKIVPQN